MLENDHTMIRQFTKPKLNVYFCEIYNRC